MSWQEFYLQWEQWWFPVTFVVSTLFVLYYGITAPWYKTPFGRALITVDAGLMVATFPEFVHIVFNSHVYDNEYVAWFIIGVASLVPVAIAYRIFTLWAVRNKKFWKSLRSRTNRSPDDGSEKEEIEE
jgi:hypothetical protein